MRNHIAALKALRDFDFDAAIQESVQKHHKTIIGLAQKQIYVDHENIFGNKLHRKDTDSNYIYSTKYTKLKKSKGVYQGAVDLSMTGDFLESFRIEFFKTYIIITAGNIKLSKGYTLEGVLRTYYGQNGSFEGLNEKNLVHVSNLITKDVSDILRKYFINKLNEL